jgi:cytochrome c553
MQILRGQYAAVVLFVVAILGAATTSAAGDAQAGEPQALVCGACHGQDGATGIDPAYPNLAGQNERYLYKQLVMIQSGERQLALMAGQLVAKSDQDLAAYYASLPGKLGQAQGDDHSIAQAEQIYRGGILNKGVVA